MTPESIGTMDREEIPQNLAERAQHLKWSGDYAGAVQVRLTLEQIHDRTGAATLDRVRNLNHLAHVAVHARALAEAERAARKCLDLYRLLAHDRDQRLATYTMMLCYVLAENGKFEEAVAWGEQALSLFTQLIGEEDTYINYRRNDIERMRNKDTRPYLDR